MPENTQAQGSELSGGLGAVKLCLFCRHCVFDAGYTYSTGTSESPSINCNAGENSYCDSAREEFAVWSRKAESCPKYEPDLG